MNWFKRDAMEAWKWQHWLAFYLLSFAFCSTLLFIQHRLFGYPWHVTSAALGAAGGTVGAASRTEWLRRKLQPRRRKRRKIL